jgi:Subtilisin inhibitor-like
VARTSLAGADNQGMRARSLCAASVVAGAIALSGAVGPAAAAPARSTLVITAFDSYDPNDPNPPTVAEMTLRCDPPGGSHPDPTRACATLKRVDGDVAALRPLPVACILIFQPVLVEVGGTWRGRPVSFQREYPNRCVAYAESEGVFRFPPRTGTCPPMAQH